MSVTKCEKNDKNQVTLEFSVAKETFDSAVEKVYRKQVKKINVPGFRPGKAPRSVVEKMYGKGVFYEDAINDIIPTAYPEAIKEAGIEPVGQPEFDIVSIDENGVVLSVKTAVKPEVAIKDYLGIEAEKTVAPVTDEEVDAEINVVRERNSRESDVEDRAPEMGDTVVIDFEGFTDGKAFEGGKGTDYSLKLGSGSFIPGFEEQIAGKEVGKEFDVNVTFPEDYHAKELAGKPAVFKTTVKKVKKIELPELDDDFAKDVSEFDTFAEYRADVKAKIEKRHETAAENEFEEKLMSALIDKLEADIPEAMFVAETENFVRDYDNRLRMQGLDLNTYFKYTGMTLDQLREQLRPQAERQVKCRLALEKIAELENIAVTEEEIEEEIKRIADSYGMEIDKVKELVERDAVAADLKVKKASDLVKEKAVAVAAKPAKKAPAKKTASKAKTAEKAPKAEESAEETEEKKPAEKKPAAKKTTAKKTAAKTEDKAE